MATAILIPLQLRHNIVATLARVRIARAVGDEHEATISERRLNWLLEQIGSSTCV